MAYATLVSLTQTINLTLNHPQNSISPQEKNQMTRLKECAILLHEFLEDFPDKANSFEGRIRELAQGAEDILEFSLSERIERSSCASVGSSKKKHEHLRYDSYDVMNEVTKEIEFISEKVMEIKNSITAKDERGAGDSTRAATSPSKVAPKEAMVGLENNLMEVKVRLCRDSSKLEILPIVGMAGIGKTTLARHVYDDPLIMERFDIRAWVTASQDYNLEEIVSGLLVSMGVSKPKNQSVEVYRHLKRRRYLILIDDIWSVEAWDEIKLMFPDDDNGSRILLTTRLLDVATYAGSFHEMRLLDDAESWNLLRRRVFKQDPCPYELKIMGKMIARSCRGLPLAVVVISGLLVVDQTQVAWENIAKDMKSAISAYDEQIDKILSLSYTHLPQHLRPCFLYMGGFPEDYKMRVSTLVKVWVAEGFLKPDGDSKSFEETAEEYLEDLVNRSLFLVIKRKPNGRIKTLAIHDLMREMCIKKAKEENFFIHVKGSLQQARARFPLRVSTIDSDLKFHENIHASTTRTIICSKHTHGQERCSLEHFKLLRILVVSDAVKFFRAKDFDRSKVFELFHLRYLAFDCPFKIPASILNLQNLQTLIIGLKKYRAIMYAEFFFGKLPVEIWRMPQLRHLLSNYGLPPLEEAAEVPLENLQTISGVTNFVCSGKIVKMIPNLKKLGLIYFIRWSINTQRQCKEEYELENLKYLQQLEILKIAVKGHYGHPKLNPAFPMTLKKLTLYNVGLSWEDMEAVASLPHLQLLKLRVLACVGDTWETIEGGFSELRFLLIDTSPLRQWITESSHFPKLKCLVLYRCGDLDEIPESIGEISTLELIEVDDRNKSLVRSAKHIQDDQQSCGNDALQVRILMRFW